MSTNSTSQTQEMGKKKLEVIAKILAIMTGLFTVVQVVTQQPSIALITTLIGAVIASVYFIRKEYVVETILAWLVAAVIGLFVFVLFPRSMKVAGIVYDANGSPISGEQVILIDATGVERKGRTDKQGKYEFKEIPVGIFELQVRDTRTGGEGKNPFTGPKIVIYVPPVPTLTSTPTPTATPVTLTLTAIPTATPTSTTTPTPTMTPTPTIAPTPTVTPSQSPSSILIPPRPECDPDIIITSPFPGENVGGKVSIVGTARHSEFDFYKVEYGFGVNPDEFIAVSDIVHHQVTDDILDIWNTKIDAIPAGTYTLKLTVVKLDGNEAPPCGIKVNVEK